jgi:multiple sugar transport system permease protein
MFSNLNTRTLKSILVKYFAHGLLFSIINLTLSLVWVFFLTGVAVFVPFLGLVVGILGILGLTIVVFLIYFFVEAGINTFLTKRIWKIPIISDWKSLIVHGFVLFVALLVVSAPLLIVILYVPSLPVAVVLFLLYCFVDGYVAKSVASSWQEARKMAHLNVSILFLVPAFLLLVVFVFYPVIRTVYQSFLAQGTGAFVGLGNYNYVLFEKINPLINIPDIKLGMFPLGALIHNMMWIAIHLPLTVFFGLGFAVLLRGVRGGTIIKSIVFLGVVIPMVVGGVLFRFIYDKDAGVINELLRLVGLGSFARDWTAFQQTALISVILGSVWIWTGFAMIIYSAGLEGIPSELYEAAEIDGASRWKTFWRITVPMLRSTTMVIITLTVLWELKVFDIVYVATQGGPGGASSVMAYEMYVEAFTFPADFGAASAIAVLLTVLTFGVAAYMVSRMSKP